MADGYFQTPNAITTLAPRVGFAAAWVYVLLLRHRDAEGKCWPKQETLSEESGLSVMTVRRAIERLQAEGLITTERTGRANVFTVNNLIVLTEQSDRQERTIRQQMNNQMHTTEQSDCSFAGGSPSFPSLPAPSNSPVSPSPIIPSALVLESENSPHPPASLFGDDPQEGASKSKARPTVAQKPPLSSEVEQYMVEELHAAPIDAARFYDHFTANGWKVSGKAPMKDWQAAARNWMRGKGRFEPVRGSPLRNGHYDSELQDMSLQERADYFAQKYKDI